MRKDWPTIEDVTQQNIESILCLEEERWKSKSLWYRSVEKCARFCGSTKFLWINLSAFCLWISWNTCYRSFDPYPFTFLILIVSLEAIILTILILISQNLASAESERRHHLDLQINLLNEREMTAMMRLVTLMADKMGIDHQSQAELDALALNTDPAKVLSQIVKAEHQHRR